MSQAILVQNVYYLLLDVLVDFDDVQNIFGNYELSDALMEKLG